MSPLVSAAVFVIGAGLFAAGYLTGRVHAWWRTPEEPSAAAPPLAQFEVVVMGRTLRTDAVIDTDQLDTLANAIGRYTLPLPTSARQ